MVSLAQMLRSEDMGDFHLALSELSTMPKHEGVRLLEQLALEPDVELRCRAASGMAKIAPERAEALALQFLDDPDPDVRVNAVYTLYELGSRTAAPLIAQLLASDPDELVRSWAALALGSLGDASVIPVLTTAVEQDTGADHEGRPIRETALKSIEHIRSRFAGNPATH
jgi:HEAT repeat protein